MAARKTSAVNETESDSMDSEDLRLTSPKWHDKPLKSVTGDYLYNEGVLVLQNHFNNAIYRWNLFRSVVIARDSPQREYSNLAFDSFNCRAI